MSPGNCFRPVETGSSRERTVIGAAVAAACTILLLDQLTKVLVERNFMLHESRVVIENFFNLSYVRNYGAAWSILSGYGWFLLLIAALVTAAALWFFRYLTEGYPERYFAIFISSAESSATPLTASGAARWWISSICTTMRLTTGRCSTSRTSRSVSASGFSCFPACCVLRARWRMIRGIVRRNE